MNAPRVEVYRGADRQFYWRRRATNGRIVGTAGEGYRTRWGARRAARRENPELEVVDR